MARYRATALSMLIASTSLSFATVVYKGAVAQGTVPESVLQGPSYSLKDRAAQPNSSDAEAQYQPPALPPGAPPLPGTPIGPDSAVPPLPSFHGQPLQAEPSTSLPASAQASTDSITRAYISGLQRSLPSHGYRVGPQTGHLDPMTEAAILDYQRDAGIAQNTRSAMSLKETLDSVSFVKPAIMAHRHGAKIRYPMTYPLQPSADGSVRWVQERLNIKGYDVGSPDGRMGRHTADAIMAFEAEHSLPREAAITPALIDQLRQ